MGHFSEKLRQLMALENLTQEDLAARSLVDRTLISRMLRAKVPTRDQLAALCGAISSDSTVRAELLVSHLLDEAHETFKRAGIDSRHVRIEVTSGTVDDGPQAPYGDWPIRLRVELDIIGSEALRTVEMREVVSAWAQQVEACEAERRKLRSKA